MSRICSVFASQVSLRSVSICQNTVGIAYETSSSATEENADFQSEDDQEVELVCMFIRKISLSPLMILRIKKEEESCCNWLGHRALQEETENVIRWHDTTK